MNKACLVFALSIIACPLTKSNTQEILNAIKKGKNQLERILRGEKNLPPAKKIIQNIKELSKKAKDEFEKAPQKFRILKKNIGRLLLDSQTLYDLAEFKKDRERIAGLKKAVGILEESLQEKGVQTSGYYLTKELFYSKKAQEEIGTRETKNLLNKIKELGKKIVEAWTTELKTILDDIKSGQSKIMERKILALQLKDEEEAAALRKEITTIIKNLLGAQPYLKIDIPYPKLDPEKKLKKIELLDLVEFSETEKKEIQKTIDEARLFLQKFLMAEKKIKMAEQTAEKIIKKLNIASIRTLNVLKSKHKSAIESASKQRGTLGALVRISISKAFQTKALELTKQYRKTLENEKRKIEKKLEKKSLTNTEVKKLEETVEHFNQMVLDKLGNPNYDYCIFRIMNPINRSQEQDATMGYFDFIGKTQKTIEKIRSKYKGWEDVV